MSACATRFASSVPVKVLVTDPIWNSVSVVALIPGSCSPSQVAQELPSFTAATHIAPAGMFLDASQALTAC